MASLAEAGEAASPPWVRPTLLPMGERRIAFTELRHPVVEAEEETSFIPNDVALSGEDAALVVVTGTPVPASYRELSWGGERT